MRLLSFLFAVRFWVPAWLVILFLGLTPVPSWIELIILVGFLAHVVWFAHRRFRRVLIARAEARADKTEEAKSAGFAAGGLVRRITRCLQQVAP
jgi:hypothetical protein